MKSEKFSTALGEIDVSYIEEVVNYKSANKRKKQIRFFVMGFGFNKNKYGCEIIKKMDFTATKKY